MRTICCSGRRGVCFQGWCASRGVCFRWEGVCVLIGGVCFQGECASGRSVLWGVCFWGVCFQGVVCFWGRCASRVCASGGMYPSMHWADTPHPWTEWQMLVKILPCRNYVADGKNNHLRANWQKPESYLVFCADSASQQQTAQMRILLLLLTCASTLLA